LTYNKAPAILKPLNNKGEHMKSNYTVFLDVDGVINSLTHLWTNGNAKFSSVTNAHQAGRYTIWVPDYMPELVQSIEANANLYWLTTWRDKANEHISDILGISKTTPVISDGTEQRDPSWKFKAVRPLAEQLNEEGQEILWIEDFGRTYSSNLTGTLKFVDTDFNGEGVLLPQHLPYKFMEHLTNNGYTGPTYIEAPTNSSIAGERNLSAGV
jgi:hypothetical protein